jgi:Outer membrane protein
MFSFNLFSLTRNILQQVAVHICTLLLCIWLLLQSVTVCAQLLTVEQAIEIALKNNYDILLARNEAEIASRNNSVGHAGMLPRITGTISDNFTLNNLNQKFTNGSEINTSGVTGINLSAGVALNWTLFDGLRMFAAKTRLQNLEEAALLQLKNEMQSVIANVLISYYDVVRANQQLKAIEEAIKISEERVKLADAKFKAVPRAKQIYCKPGLI